MGIYVNKDVFAEAGVELPPKDWTGTSSWRPQRRPPSSGQRRAGLRLQRLCRSGVINTWGLWMIEDPSVGHRRRQVRLQQREAYAGLQRIQDLAQKDKVTRRLRCAEGFRRQGWFHQQAVRDDRRCDRPAAQFKGRRSTSTSTRTDRQRQQADRGRRRPDRRGRAEGRAEAAGRHGPGRYLTSSEVQEDVPPGSNVPTGFYLAPGARKSVKVSDRSRSSCPGCPICGHALVPSWAQFTRLMHPEYQNIIFGKETPKEAMERSLPRPSSC